GASGAPAVRRRGRAVAYRPEWTICHSRVHHQPPEPARGLRPARPRDSAPGRGDHRGTPGSAPMIPPACELERFFARYEFTVEHILGASDVDGLPMAELLELADPHLRELWDSLTLGYTETPGHPVLREAIAGLYERVAPDEVVVCGGGAVEALFLLFNAIL